MHTADIPLFPTISAVVTFLKFEHIDSETPEDIKSLFQIPSDYNKSKIQMNFDFQEKEPEDGEEEDGKQEIEEGEDDNDDDDENEENGKKHLV